jgi:dTDP-4-amino-4,6-dideoxygalactose transaminase
MILFRDRASTVLYDVLMTLNKSIKFLLPLNICPIVPDTFIKAKIEFEFVDIDIDTLCMDEGLALEAIKNDSSIGGILFVKTFGIEIDSEVFYKKIKQINRDIFIIDDQCLSMQNFDFDIDSSFASLTLFSTGYSKYVDIGYGGFGFLKDSHFKGFFQDNGNSKSFLNYQVDVKEKIPLMQKHKAKLNTIYQKGIPSNLHLGKAFENWRFSILIDNKDNLLKAIFQEEDLFASSHYAPIDHKYTDNPIQDSNAHKISSKIVNLFNDFRFTEEKAMNVVRVIDNFLE